jgi:type III pantothenate kinase
MKSRRATAGPRLLLIDSGNSRLKWALARLPYRRRQRFEAGGVLELSKLRRSDVELVRALRAAPDGTRLWVCNVAGLQIQRRICAAARRAGMPAPPFVHSAATAAGVRNGYTEPWRLGADRWAALVGAHHEYPGEAICIVGIGSAMTIDLLDANGRHEGGSIIPGPQMMIAALLRETAGIRRRAALQGTAQLARALASLHSLRGRRAPLFAANTRAALLSGACHACASLIERALEQGTRQLHRAPRLLIGGGAAASVAPLLSSSYRQSDDLVLRGMAVLAQSGEAAIA